MNWYDTIFIIFCLIMFITITMWNVDIPANNEPFRIIAGTSIDPPRSDWGYTSDYCSVRICNI